MPQHTHATALQLLAFAAFYVVVHVTAQTFAGRHPDSPFWRAVAYSL